MGTNPKAELEEKLRSFVGVDIGSAWVAAEPVNEAMIHQYCAVVGDESPVYHDAKAARGSVHKGIVAPPTMLQAWVMPGLKPPLVVKEGAPVDRQVELHRLFDSYGYTGVVATNQEQEYDRYLRPGDRLSTKIVIDSISPEKATPLGLGYFVTTVLTFSDQDGERVGRMTFRVLKFKPQQQAAQPGAGAAAAARPRRMRPPMGHDNAWWWEGIQRGELLIQKCSDCGHVHHPPRPMCGRCQSVKWGAVRASGRATVYSFTVLHHPKIPGFEYPLVCAVVELEEGTRLVSNVVGCDADDVRIGMPVELSIENVDEEMKLQLFRPAQ